MRKCAIYLSSLVALSMLLPAVAASQPAGMILEIPEDVGRRTIPADCSHWHELYPQYCGGYHQLNFIDVDQDNLVSGGDMVYLDYDLLATPCILYIVEDVQIVHETDCDGMLLEPLDWQPGSPVCQDWLEIHPEYGNTYHVEDWIDDGDGEVGPGDTIVLEGGLTCEINHSGWSTDVTETVPTEQHSWSGVKHLFTVPF